MAVGAKRFSLSVLVAGLLLVQAGTKVQGQQGGDTVTVSGALCWTTRLTCVPDSRHPLVVGWYEQVSQRVVSSNTKEMTFRATLINHGAGLAGARATAQSLSPSLSIVDGSLSFGAVGSGGTVVSSDTFTLRQTGSAFSWANLQWQIAPLTFVPGEGVILSGGSSSRALDALTRVDPAPAAAADIVDGIILTRLDVAITAQATVGQVNAALAAIGGGIVTMRPGLPVMTVAVPKQPDATALQQLADRLKAYPGIRLVLLGRSVDPAIKPDAGADPPDFDHLAAARFPAAWNVQELADCGQKVNVLVTDAFGAVADSALVSFEQEVPGASVDIARGSTAGHGYNVLATMAARFNLFSPTGANPYPACLNIHGVQILGLSSLQIVLALDAALPADGPVVVNSSLGFVEHCDAACFESWAGPRVTPAIDRALAGLIARHLLRPHQNRLFIASSAGNSANNLVGQMYLGARSARYDSWHAVAATSDSMMSWITDPALWAPAPGCGGVLGCPSLAASPDERAALDGLIADLDETEGASLQNVLIVGSTANTATRVPSAFSEVGADVFAVGEAIPAITGGYTNGTSFAAPQVAGLASYLLMVQPWARNDPDAIANVTSAIMSNRAAVPVPFIDAFASTLAVDPAGTPDPATWHVRRKLLDVSGDGGAPPDGRFTESDIEAFIARFFEPPDYSVPVSVAPRDFSRYDLNGDGETGGTSATGGMPPFDLDRTGSQQHGAPLLTTLTLDIFGAEREIDEHHVSDLDVLCYYAYSPLYEGITTVRDVLLEEKCVESSFRIVPGDVTLAPGASIDFDAEIAGLPDTAVEWSVPAGGGSIDPQTGVFTAGSAPGTFSVIAVRLADEDDVAEAIVRIREDEDPIPPGTYAGTIVQRHTFRPAGVPEPTTEVEVRWNVRMATSRRASTPEVTGTAHFRSVYREYYQGYSDVPMCLLSTTTTEGDLSITFYSGSYDGNDPSRWGLGGYYLAGGTVTSTYDRTDCVGNPDHSEGTRYQGVSTAGSLGNYIPSTLPTLVLDGDGNVTALTWNYRYDSAYATDEVTGQVTRAP